MSTRYSLTDEHRAQLKPWADKWITIALSTEIMSAEERVAVGDAVRGMYSAAKLPAPKRVVFAAGPVSGALAAGIAAGVWWLRNNPAKHAELFGRAITDAELSAAIGPACRLAVAGALGMTRLAIPAVVNNAATDAVTRAATSAATMDATWDATEVATRAATAAATRTATWAATMGATEDATRAATRAATWDATWTATREATADATWTATEAATRAATADATWTATEAATRAATEAATWTATEAATSAATWEATEAATWAAPVVAFILGCCRYANNGYNGGNQWAGWVAFLSFFRHVAQRPLDYSKWQHYETAAEHGGPRWMFPDFTIVADRPATLLVDDRNRPHCATGPSHVWRDGWRLYYWHGTNVSQRLIEAPESYTADEILAETNSEVVRALAERLGWPAFVEKLGAATIDSWTDPTTGLDYALLELGREVNGRRPRFLRMRSPELQDGTRPEYLEPVDPGLNTAQAARRWQFRSADGSWPSVDSCNNNPEMTFSQEA